jgi:hypothetical protein
MCRTYLRYASACRRTELLSGNHPGERTMTFVLLCIIKAHREDARQDYWHAYFALFETKCGVFVPLSAFYPI